MQQTPNWVKKVLARPELEIEIPDSYGRVLVTGANGSIGSYCFDTLFAAADDVLATDVSPSTDARKWEHLDVTDYTQVSDAFEEFRPEIVLHLAGAKHAPLGEEDPYQSMTVNTVGTLNVLRAADSWARDAKVIVASTCKACDPETAYGASKLIAERMTLNAGQVVVRFYNVVETAANVFGIWDEAARNEQPIPVTPCVRYFMSAREAVALTLWATEARTGRYALARVRPVTMNAVARELHPRAKRVEIPPRRGDRLKEPRMAKSEKGEKVSKEIVKITSAHDPR